MPTTEDIIQVIPSTRVSFKNGNPLLSKFLSAFREDQGYRRWLIASPTHTHVFLDGLFSEEVSEWLRSVNRGR